MSIVINCDYHDNLTPLMYIMYNTLKIWPVMADKAQCTICSLWSFLIWPASDKMAVFYKSQNMFFIFQDGSPKQSNLQLLLLPSCSLTSQQVNISILVFQDLVTLDA